jgi:chromosome segregation protein
MMEQTTSSNSNSNNKDKNKNNSLNELNDLKQLKSKYYESELEKEGLNSLVESLKTKIRTLQQQIFSQESSNQLTQELESQKGILLEQVESYKKRVNDSDLQLNIIKKELNTLREENNDYIRKYNELQQQNVQIRQLNNLLELDKQHLNKKLRETEDEQIILQRELRQCNEQSNLIEDNVNEIKTSFEKLDADYRVLQCKNSELELEIENLQCEVKRLREKCVLQYHEIDESNKLNDRLKGDIEDLQRLFIEQDRVLREKNHQGKTFMSKFYIFTLRRKYMMIDFFVFQRMEYIRHIVMYATNI